jgi:arsenate reductase
MDKPSVLFLCTGNSCRSQMAEAFLRHYGGDSFEVHSAGTNPRPIHPLTIAVMQELGIDLASHSAKDVKDILGRMSVDYLIVVCNEANASCPRVFPGVKVRWFWSLPDPAVFAGSAEERLSRFRSVRDQIARKVREMISVTGAAELSLPAACSCPSGPSEI